MANIQSQPPYPGAKPEEVAEIIINDPRMPGDVSFSDWETVWVQHRWKDVIPVFRFTSAERDPIPDLWQRLQIVPDTDCLIKLGGQLAITGIITIRQTAYDANSHAVSIQGVGRQWLTWRGAILDPTQEHPGDYVAVATKVMAEFKVTPKVIPVISGLQFKPPAHNEVGDSVFQFLERIGRDRKVCLGSDHEGNCLIIGEHDFPVVDELTEGVNILSCQCVMNLGDIYDPYVARGQRPRSDEGSPADAAKQDKYVKSKVISRYTPLLTPLEHPVWTPEEVALRALTEATWGDGTLIEATVVVYGWFTSGGVLWCQLVGHKVILNSPMTTLVGEALAIRSVTHTQDRQSGTRTTLDLVAPWLLNDHGFRASSTGKPSQINEAPGSGDVKSDSSQKKFSEEE